MKLTRLVLAALLFAAPLSLVPYASAQDTDKNQPAAEAYLVTVAIKISEQGKITSDQTYTITATTNTQGASPSVRDGDRIPTPTGSTSTTGADGEHTTQWQYVDTGTNIDVRNFRRIGDLITLNVNIEKSLTTPNPDLKLPTVIRNIRYSLDPGVHPGKAVTIFSSNDATTGHKVEIQLTLQPLNK